MDEKNQLKFRLRKSNEDRIRFCCVKNSLCPQLHSLNISFCNLSRLPKIIFSLINITELNLNNNCLMSLPNEIGNLHNLIILNLSGNKLNSLPDSVKFMHNLNTLDISNNNFSEVPGVLYCSLGVLKLLDLSFNNLSNFDCIPQCINTLKILNLSYNKLKNLPNWIFYSLCQLIGLNVGSNCIFLDFQTNDFFTARVFESLQFLNVENCQLSSEKVNFLYQFKNLEVLCMGNKMNKSKNIFLNYLGNLKVDALKNLKTLKGLYLQNVQISTLSSGLSWLKNLEILDLSENLLSWLPECLCDLVSLKILNLMCNQLLFLPTNIGKLVNLQELHLGNNNLYLVPEGIYNLNNLEYIDFYNNKLEDISFIILKKKKLKGIDLGLNYLIHNFYDSDIKLKYEHLKNSLRQRFDYVNIRSDVQLMKSSCEDSSNGLHNSTWSSSSCTSGCTSDEDIEVAVPQNYAQDDFQDDFQEEIWEAGSVGKEDDFFNPNEFRFISHNLGHFKDGWTSEFRNNFCPAFSHKNSFKETYAKNVSESVLEYKSVEGQFDSD